MEDTKKNVTAPAVEPTKAPAKPKAKPKATKKVAKKSIKSIIIETNLARGFFLTGLLGIIFFGLLVGGVLDFLPNTVEEFFTNDTQLFQLSIGLFAIGAFSFTKK